MKNWTIGKRLVSGFSILIFIIICFGTLTWVQMQGISRGLDLITEDNLSELRCTEEIRYQVALLRITNFKHVLYDATKRADLEKEADAEEAKLAGLLHELEGHFQMPEQRPLYAQIPPLWAAYRAETRKLREASAQNNAEAVKTLLASAGKIGNDFIRSVEVCEAFSDKEIKNNAGQVEATVRSSKRAVLVSSILVGILGFGCALLISRSIGRVLHRLVAELSAGAEQTTAAAGQVSSSSQSLAEGASEQAASLEESSASLEELSTMTRRNAENAQKANDLARQARSAADKGATDMHAMSAAMDAIKVSSDDIAKIIKTIDEIAFQTNILALNAAVEAARAGEAGMGFAVVADEVRSLAQRSAQAAKETAAKIEGAITKTAQGVDINKKVAQALNDIVIKARQVDELVAEVTSASKEQTQGITQINMAVGQMDKVTQSNAANAEESAAAAEQLNAQAETMKQSVAQLLKLVGGRNESSACKTAVAKEPVRRTQSPAVVKRPASASGNGRSHAPLVLAKVGSSRRSETAAEEAFKDF